MMRQFLASCGPSTARRLARSQKGIAATEFALIAPVFLTLVIGMFHFSHMAYAKAVLEGAVQKAARDSSLESGDTAAADAMVEKMVKPVLPGVVLETERLNFYDLADVNRPEKWTDNKGKSGGVWIEYPGRNNGICDQGEAYVDENRTGKWEPNVGVAGNGGAQDVVLYRVEAHYVPLFKIPFLPAHWTEKTLVATALTKNQPFASQIKYSTTPAGTCT